MDADLKNALALMEKIRIERTTTPKSELKCVNCHKHPTVFHADKARKEFEEISQICGACWEVVTLETDAEPYDIAEAKKILKLQNREYFFEPRGWKCLKCNVVLQHEFGKDICKCKE